MKIYGHYGQVDDTSHGCNHENLDVILDSRWQMIECTHCKKRWERLTKCCAIGCDLFVEEAVLPFCTSHMKDEALVRAWEEL